MRINSNSVGTLVLGVLSIIIPIFGLILGFVGIYFYNKARKEMLITNEGGGGIALTGLICNVVGIIIQFITLLSLILLASVISSSF
jgi:hypothetical protein